MEPPKHGAPTLSDIGITKSDSSRWCAIGVDGDAKIANLRVIRCTILCTNAGLSFISLLNNQCDRTCLHIQVPNIE